MEDSGGFTWQMSAKTKSYGNVQVQKKYSGSDFKNMDIFIEGEIVDTITVDPSIDQSNWPDAEERKTGDCIQDRKLHYALNLKFDPLNRWCPDGIAVQEYKGITTAAWAAAVSSGKRPVVIKPVDKAHVNPDMTESDYGYFISSGLNVCQKASFKKGINQKRFTIVSRDIWPKIQKGDGNASEKEVIIKDCLRNRQNEVTGLLVRIGPQLFLAPTLKPVDTVLPIALDNQASGWEGPPPTEYESSHQGDIIQGNSLVNESHSDNSTNGEEELQPPSSSSEDLDPDSDESDSITDADNIYEDGESNVSEDNHVTSKPSFKQSVHGQTAVRNSGRNGRAVGIASGVNAFGSSTHQGSVISVADEDNQVAGKPSYKRSVHGRTTVRASGLERVGSGSIPSARARTNPPRNVKKMKYFFG